LAEDILERGDADLIALGRPLFADPDFPRKAKGELGRGIRPCIACNTCFDNLFVGNPVKCAVNPELKHGRKVEVIKGGSPKKVLVIGGGPAGMEAALILAQNNHRVSLWESKSHLGGQLILAMASPGRKEFKRLISYYSEEMQKLGVEVNLNSTATIEQIADESPDAIILSTGVNTTYPQIMGLDRAQTPTAHDVLSGKATTGNKIVIIGGGHTGCETAKFLAKQNKKVTVLRRGPKMAIEAGWSIRKLLLEELISLGVVLITGVEYKKIQPNKLSITVSGEERVLPFETIVVATGVESNNSLYKSLEGKFEKIYLVGDAAGPGDVAKAIEEARLAALEI
jgi:2,4-dienoyl-CoA reductase (NADPH2)